MNKLAGFYSLEQSRQREAWERERITWMQIANWSGYAKNGKSPGDMMKFPWDAKAELKAPVMSRERFEHLKKKYDGQK